MMRPPTCSGQPALGMTEKTRLGHGLRAFALRMRRIWLGPPEQLMPITSAPAVWITARHLGRAVAQQGAVVAGEGHRGDHGQVRGCLRGRPGSLRRLRSRSVMVSMISRSTPASARARICSRKAGAGLLGLDAPKRRQTDAQRADIAGDEHRL